MKLSKLINTTDPGDAIPALTAVVSSSKPGKNEGSAWIHVRSSYSSDAGHRSNRIILDKDEQDEEYRIFLSAGIYPTDEAPLPSEGDIIQIVGDKRGEGITTKQGKESLYFYVDERATVQVTVPDENEETQEEESQSTENQSVVEGRELNDTAKDWLDKRMELFNAVNNYISGTCPSYPESAIPPLATSLFMEGGKSFDTILKTAEQTRRANKTEKEVGSKAQLGAAKKVTKKAVKKEEPKEPEVSEEEDWKSIKHPKTGKSLGELGVEEIAKNSTIKWYFTGLIKGVQENLRAFHGGIGLALAEKVGSIRDIILQYVENVVVEYTNKTKEQISLIEKIQEELEETHLSQFDDVETNEMRGHDAVLQVDEIFKKLTSGGDEDE